MSDDVHEHEHHRMDDDGGCVQPVFAKIGIAPEAKADASVVRLVGCDVPIPAKPSGLVMPNGQPVNAGPVKADLVGITGETLTSLTWDKYLPWRQSKCRPFNYKGMPRYATTVSASDPECRDGNRVRALEEIDQATLELIGEAAELGELFLGSGPLNPFFDGPLRDKLIDECGDILFCGCWAMDAWGENPLIGADDLELVRVEDGSELAGMANAFITYSPEAVNSNQRFRAIMSNAIQGMLVGMQTAAGLLANSFKKLKYQRREQDAELQIGRIASVLTIANQILIIANSSVEEALKSNMRKLDARYPDGYKTGQGGGIRTGQGK